MSKTNLNVTIPPLHLPFLATDGKLSTYWHSVLLTLYNRTGGLNGISSGASISTATAAHNTAVAAQITATTGVHSATAAQASADAGITAANAAQTTADAANAGVARLNTVSVFKASFQADGIAPSANPTFSGAITLPIFVNAPDDATAAALGVGLNQMYANGSVLMVRQA